MIDELTKTATLADSDLKGSLARLSKIEAAVGSDLAELRVLNNEATSDDGTLHRTRTEVESELRQALRRGQSQRAIAGAAERRRGGSGPVAGHAQPPAGIAAGAAAAEGRIGGRPAPHRRPPGPHVGRTSPGAGRQGSRGGDRPPPARRAGHRRPRRRGRPPALGRSRRQAPGQLSRNHRPAPPPGRIPRRLQQPIGGNQQPHAAAGTGPAKPGRGPLRPGRAKAASLLTCIDSPDAGIRPLGPSRAAIILLGIAGGLLLGFGVVFLTVPKAQPGPAAARRTNWFRCRSGRPRPSGRSCRSSPPVACR